VVGQEFPADATVLWYAVKDTCAQMEVKSAALGKVLGQFGDPEGQVFVELYSVQPGGNAIYDSQDINEGLFVMLTNPTASDAPAC